MSLSSSVAWVWPRRARLRRLGPPGPVTSGSLSLQLRADQASPWWKWPWRSCDQRVNPQTRNYSPPLATRESERGAMARAGHIPEDTGPTLLFVHLRPHTTPDTILLLLLNSPLNRPNQGADYPVDSKTDGVVKVSTLFRLPRTWTHFFVFAKNEEIRTIVRIFSNIGNALRDIVRAYKFEVLIASRCTCKTTPQVSSTSHGSAKTKVLLQPYI